MVLPLTTYGRVEDLDHLSVNLLENCPNFIDFFFLQRETETATEEIQMKETPMKKRVSVLAFGAGNVEMFDT